MEGHQLWIKHKQGCGQSFILVLPQAAALPGKILAAIVLSQHRVSSSRTIRPCTACYAQCRLWGTLLRRGLRFVQCRCTRNPVKERDSIVHGRMESHNTSLYAIDLYPSCLKQAHSNRIPIGWLMLVISIKALNLDVFSYYSVFHLYFVLWVMLDWRTVFSCRVGLI